MDLLEHHSTFATINFISEKNKIFADKIASSHNHLIKNIRSLGTILAFEIIEGKDEYLNGISSIITKKAMDQHVYIRPLGNTVYIMPPYCITEAELTAVYAVIEKILNEWN